MITRGSAPNWDENKKIIAKNIKYRVKMKNVFIWKNSEFL